MDVTKYRQERIFQPISTVELERRWQEVRKMMMAKSIDCLVMQNNSQFLGGYVRWFTDVPAVNGYPLTVIFPLEGEMTIVSSGGPPIPAYPPEWAVRGAKVVPASYFLTFNYTKLLDAEIIAKTIEENDAKVVGLLGENFIPASLYNYLRKNLPLVELIEAADYVDEIKAIKSQEEIALIRKCAAIQDIGMAAVPDLLKPGMREFELRSALEHMMIDLGSEEKWIMIGSAPAGQLSNQKHPFLQNRVIEKGDQVCVMNEVNGPGGFYAEVGRTYVLGKPTIELKSIWEESVEAQQHTASLLKPGAHPADIFNANNKFLMDRGYPPEGRLYAHGQGYDLVERPAIRTDETMLIKENMNIAVHPRIVTKIAHAYCCDNYLVTANGSQRIHETPLALFVV